MATRATRPLKICVAVSLHRMFQPVNRRSSDLSGAEIQDSFLAYINPEPSRSRGWVGPAGPSEAAGGATPPGNKKIAALCPWCLGDELGFQPAFAEAALRMAATIRW
jgi:hypothetical protein